MRDKRLAGVGTGEDSLPPGINPHHAYAILGFDPATDRVQLWNPHGNYFRPRGEPGLANGYPTQAGRFEIPVADFVRIFNSASFETNRDPGPDTGPRSSRGN